MMLDEAFQLSRGEPLMFLILLVLLAAVLVAGLVVVYVAYPYRGEEVPRAAWLGDALSRSRAVLPVLDEDGYARTSSRR